MSPAADVVGTDVRAHGERIDALLDALSVGGPVARERAEELVRLVVELYGAGLERLLEIAHSHGALTQEVLDALAADELVSGLLVVHGLHPDGVTDRVEAALAGVRPYLGSHGGDVRVLGVTDDGVVRLQLLGSCDGCASSSVTLELAVQDAVLAAAPEVTRIEVEQPAATRAQPTLIPVGDLTARLRTDTAGAPWLAAARLDELLVGRLDRRTVGGVDLVLCRLLSGVYAYRDRCAGCGASFEDAGLERALATPGTAVLTCRGCSARYDVRAAGAELGDLGRHLEPVPLLERDGVVEVAVRTAVPA